MPAHKPTLKILAIAIPTVFVVGIVLYFRGPAAEEQPISGQALKNEFSKKDTPSPSKDIDPITFEVGIGGEVNNVVPPDWTEQPQEADESSVSVKQSEEDHEKTVQALVDTGNDVVGMENDLEKPEFVEETPMPRLTLENILKNSEKMMNGSINNSDDVHSMNNATVVSGASMNNATVVSGASMNNATVVSGASMNNATVVSGASMNNATVVSGASMNNATVVSGASMNNATVVSGASMNNATVVSGASMNNATVVSGASMNNVTVVSVPDMSNNDTVISPEPKHANNTVVQFTVQASIGVNNSKKDTVDSESAINQEMDKISEETHSDTVTEVAQIEDTVSDSTTSAMDEAISETNSDMTTPGESTTVESINNTAVIDTLGDSKNNTEIGALPTVSTTDNSTPLELPVTELPTDIIAQNVTEADKQVVEIINAINNNATTIETTNTTIFENGTLISEGNSTIPKDGITMVNEIVENTNNGTISVENGAVKIDETPAVNETTPENGTPVIAENGSPVAEGTNGTLESNGEGETTKTVLNIPVGASIRFLEKSNGTTLFIDSANNGTGAEIVTGRESEDIESQLERLESEEKGEDEYRIIESEDDGEEEEETQSSTEPATAAPFFIANARV